MTGATAATGRVVRSVAGLARKRAKPWRKPSGPVTVARLSSTALPRADHTAARWPGGHETVAGTNLYVRHLPSTAAASELAVYVHGLAGSSTNWTDLGLLLRPWVDGVAFDLPGFGRSGPAPRDDYSIGGFARVLTAQIEHENRGPVHLFGNSMGGAVSLRVAADRPDLVRTLTLISPAVPDLRVHRPGTDAGVLLLLVPGARGAVEKRLAAVTAEARARGLITLCFADPSRVPPQRVAEAIEDVRERQQVPWAADAFTRSLRGLVASYLSTGPRSPWRRLAQISAPTLVIWGDQDRLVDVALAPRVARTVPDARLLVLPDTGHVAQLEDPVSTARAFLGMLEDCRRYQAGGQAPTPTLDGSGVAAVVTSPPPP